MHEDITTTRVRMDPEFERLANPHLKAARAALIAWAKAVSSGNVEDVLALYADDAILVPTMSDDVGGHEDERREYFQRFLANPGLRCRIDSLRKRISHKLGTVVVGGHYTFTFLRDGTQAVVPARFLFTFEEVDGRWLITGHHSSQFV